MKIRLLLFLLCANTLFAFSQFQPVRYQIDGINLSYQVSFPANYDENKQYPLLIFLHGAGERGSDNEKQLVHGKDFLLNNTQSEYPAIVIVPQCPEYSYWSNVKIHSLNKEQPFSFDSSDKPTMAMEALVTLINEWISSGKIDSKQVYVGGLSMGGMGTFELLWRMPNTFAAAFPICGGGNIAKVVDNTRNTPVWIFHGSADSVVPASNSQNMYKAMQEAGRDVKYTEYPNVNHNSWDNVFQEKDLFKWLFSHKK
ncbi:MAG: prolyl oligopeptidase family serine peptidase [Dysgonomonas sp.]